MSSGTISYTMIVPRCKSDNAMPFWLLERCSNNCKNIAELLPIHGCTIRGVASFFAVIRKDHADSEWHLDCEK